MTRQEQLEKIYRYLMFLGRIATKKDMANQLDINYTTLTQAFSGQKKYLTDNLFCFKIGAVYSDIFDYNWLRTGTGEMLKNPAQPQGVSMMNTQGVSVQATNGAEVNMPLMKAPIGNNSEILSKLSDVTAERDRLQAENIMLRNEITWLRKIVEDKLTTL